MKSILKTVSVSAFAVAFFSCQKNNTATSAPSFNGESSVTFTISGDDVYKKDTTLTITGLKDIATNYGGYNTTWNITVCNIGDNAFPTATADNTFQVYFNGSKTGKQSAGTDLNDGPYSSVEFMFHLWDKKSGRQNYYSFANINKTSGTINITKYGNVNEGIEGDFSGSLINIEDNNKIATLKNGHFKVNRIPDSN